MTTTMTMTTMPATVGCYLWTVAFAFSLSLLAKGTVLIQYGYILYRHALSIYSVMYG
jgi:hypothetical protein